MGRINKSETVVLTLAVVLVFAGISHADWQETLEAYFDHVETFDGLDDWAGTGSSYTISGGDRSAACSSWSVVASDFTQFSGNSIEWSGYWGSSNRDPSASWIQDHGTSYRWTGGNANDATNHKSIMIDHRTFSTSPMQGKGPSRFMFKIGDDPTDGYTEIFIFFAQKYAKQFFPYDQHEEKFNWFGFNKQVLASPGFKDVAHFGTVSQSGQIDATCGGEQYLQCIYGPNWVIVNPRSTSGGGARIGTMAGQGRWDSGTSCGYVSDQDLLNANGNFEDQWLAQEWIFREIRIKLPSSMNGTDGEVQVTHYDENGNSLGTNQIDDGRFFDGGTGNWDYSAHRINRIVFGGNAKAEYAYCPTLEFGTHNGGDSFTVLSDSTASFSGIVDSNTFNNADMIYNVTDGSSCKASGSTSTTIACSEGLTAGTDNTWQAGDEYVVMTYECFGQAYYYLDDIIVHGSSIATTYFALLNADIPESPIFVNGFESGDTSAWSNQVP